jgi:uncharacterized membrane protein
MNNRGSLLTGLGAGAGLAYLLDPDRGARRRARIRDTVVHAATATKRAVATTSRDARQRTYGTAAAVRGRLSREEIDDRVLVERVRSRIGRAVSHPHAIDAGAADGVVTLKGPVLTAEAPRLIRAIRSVRGVQRVVDELERHDEPGHVPALQGGSAHAGRRTGAWRRQWSPTTRCMAGTAGAALAALGVSRRDSGGALLAMLGVGLAARAAANVPLTRLAGVGAGQRAVEVQKTITINAPVGEVFAFWSWYENFPRFMSRVLDVRPSEDPSRSHWKVAGPAGVPVEFDAEITCAAWNKMLGWRTLDGSPVAHSGIVRFDALGEGRTRVEIRMAYNPPAGRLGHGVAAAFGADPKSSMDADLARMKTMIETGHAPHDAAARAAH